MKHLIYKTTTGKIIGVLESASTPRVDEDESFIEIAQDTVIDIATQYVENNTVITAPNRPGDNYIFNATTRSWYKFRPDPDLANIAVAKRSKLLSESDWVVAKYTELALPIPNEWIVYRQALRDITAQADFPNNIVWPVMPS